MILVVMAAGMGSRFGGLKQIEPVDNEKNFIIDYSIYDAIKAGFDKIVFIIRKSNYELFRDTIGKRIESKVKVEYVFQENDDLVEKGIIPKERIKPLGTSYALLCCKDAINEENFAVINADDFYGREAYETAAEFMKKNNNVNNFAMVGYKAASTMSEKGAVKRGICFLEGNEVTRIIESNIAYNEDKKIIAKPLDNSPEFEIDSNQTTSMSFFVFTKKLFKLLEDDMNEFYNDNTIDKITEEKIITNTVTKNIENGNITFTALECNAKWMGITYKEDLESLKDSISELKKENIYPENLWN